MSLITAAPLLILLTCDPHLHHLLPGRFRRKDGSYKERLGELEAVNSEKEASRQALDELKKKRLDEFMAGFDVITMKLKEMYQVGGYDGCDYNEAQGDVQ